MSRDELLEMLKLFSHAQHWMSLEDFHKIWEGHMANHFWVHFSGTYRHNLLGFYRYLGETEGKPLLDYITGPYAEANKV